MWRSTWSRSHRPHQARPASRSSGGGGECALGRVHQFGKELLAFDSERGQLFAIEIDPGLFETRDKAAVVHVVLADERVDAGDPERAKIALLLFAIAIGVGQPLFEGIAGLPVKFAAANETGGELELPLMAAAGFKPAFGAWHRESFLVSLP